VRGGSEEATRQEIEERLRFLTAVIDQGDAGIIASDPEQKIRVWSRGAEKLFGIESREALGQRVVDFEHLLPTESRPVRSGMKDDLAAGGTWEGEIELRHRSGRPFTALVRNSPLRDDAGEIVGYAGLIIDVSERKRYELELQLRARQQEAITTLGSLALSGADVPGLLEEAVRVVAEILDVEFVQVLELSEEGDLFEVRAGIGWEPGTVGAAVVPADDSHAALTLAEETVVVPDYERETRFLPSDLLRRHGLRSGVMAVIKGNERAYGVLGAHSRESRAFSQDDAQFLQAVGNVLASALARSHAGRLEAQLQQAQRLEAVGQLAGGIAHDFNNLLSVILNYVQFLLGETDDEQALADLREIEHAAKRAAELTAQLLVFSRHEVTRPRQVDLVAAIAETETLLRRTIGEHIELVAEAPPSLPPVELGSGQAEQILVNLVVNARDALIDGGTISVGVTEIGDYVVLTVRDDGIGMAEEVAAQAFDPFFTTKRAGEGTGLGLATIYGIVKGAGGQVQIESEQQRGTTVTVRLPVAGGRDALRLGDREAAGAVDGRGETVLVVEDEEGVRTTTCRILESNGYRTLSAPDGSSAEAVFEAHQSEIDLLLTDVVMPGMSGKELVESLRARQPGLKAIYMSGYAGGVVSRHGALDDGSAMLEKPFTAAELLGGIRAALE
jgi:PAS domain S-box-containing protein